MSLKAVSNYFKYKIYIECVNLTAPSTFTSTAAATAATTLWWFWILIFHNDTYIYYLIIFKQIYEKNNRNYRMYEDFRG